SLSARTPHGLGGIGMDRSLRGRRSHELPRVGRSHHGGVGAPVPDRARSRLRHGGSGGDDTGDRLRSAPMSPGWLPTIVFSPLVAALVLLFVPSSQRILVRLIAIGSTVVSAIG